MSALRSFATAITVCVLVVACAHQHDGQRGGMNKQQVGTVAGAIGGALAAKNLGKGNGQVLSIAAGTLIGAFIGNQVGQSLDRADINYLERTSQRALEKNKIGTASEWVNPDSGHSGTVTPTRTFKNNTGSYCREFTQTITIGGKNQQAYGQACRQADGTWQIVQ